MMSYLLTSATIVLAASNTNPWISGGDKDGLEVWYRDVPGQNIREVKARAVFPVAARKVWDTLSDVEHYVEFMPYMIETRIIAKHATGHFEYQHLNPPVVSRRDYTVKIDLIVDEAKGEFIRKWEIANDKGPAPQDGTVRVKDTRGSWTILKAGPTSCEVTYYVYTEPGGTIPGWIANKANTVALPDLFKAVRQRSIDPTWKP